MTGCIEEKLPCIMEESRQAGVRLEFYAPFSAARVSTKFEARVGNLIVPHESLEHMFKITFPENICESHGLTCPIVKGRKYSLKWDEFITVPVRPIDEKWKKYEMKTITVTTKITTPPFGRLMSCFKLPLQLRQNAKRKKQREEIENKNKMSKNKMDKNKSELIVKEKTKSKNSIWGQLREKQQRIH